LSGIFGSVGGASADSFRAIALSKATRIARDFLDIANIFTLEFQV